MSRQFTTEAEKALNKAAKFAIQIGRASCRERV